MEGSSAERIAGELRELIGTMSPHARMPSSRDIAARYAASPVTVQKAMRILIGMGLVETRPGAGSFVRSAPATSRGDVAWQLGALSVARPRLPEPALTTAHREGVIELSSGYPVGELLPEEVVRSALVRVARLSESMASAPAAGMASLREWFAAELSASVPGSEARSADDVVVLPGTQSGLGSIFRAVVGLGQSVVMEIPTYRGALLAAAQAGVSVLPVARDGEGPIPAELRRAFVDLGARVFYAQPTHANPTGASWSPERRAAVMRIVRESRGFLVEDDWARDFGIDSSPAPLAAHDEAGHVIYLRSISKSVSPALRVGAAIARGPARDRIAHDREVESLYVSPVLQRAALHVLQQPAWHAHRRRLGTHLAQRRDLLLDRLKEHAPEVLVPAVPAGGLHLWAHLPGRTDTARLMQDCEAEDVLVAAGAQWFPSEAPGEFMRLNFAGTEPTGFEHAAQVIGRAVRAQGSR